MNVTKVPTAVDADDEVPSATKFMVAYSMWQHARAETYKGGMNEDDLGKAMVAERDASWNLIRTPCPDNYRRCFGEFAMTLALETQETGMPYDKRDLAALAVLASL